MFKTRTISSQIRTNFKLSTRAQTELSSLARLPALKLTPCDQENERFE